MARHLNNARQASGLGEIDATPEENPFLADAFLLRTVPSVERHVLSLPRGVHCIGACEWNPEWAGEDAPASRSKRVAGLTDALARYDRPIIYVQNGRTFNRPSLWPVLVEAMGGERVTIVASVGRMEAPPAMTPANFIVRAHVSHATVLPHASVVLCGGHTSALLGAMIRGIPGVIGFGGGETADNSERLTSAGCALAFPTEQLDTVKLRGALETAMYDAQLRRRCRTIQDAFLEVPGFGAAAATVESLDQVGYSCDVGTKLGVTLLENGGTVSVPV